MTTALETTFANPTAISRHYSFLPRHGRTLGPGEAVSFIGDPAGILRRGSHARTRMRLEAMAHAIQLGQLSVVTQRRPVLWDTTLIVPKALRVNSGSVGGVNPDYSSDLSVITTTTTSAPTTTTTAGAAPAAPTSPAASLSGDGSQANISWVHAGTGVSYFRIDRRYTLPGGTATAFAQAATVPVADRQAYIDITAYPPGTLVEFRIAAANAQNVLSAYTSTVGVTRP